MTTVSSLGFRILGFRVWGLGFRILGFRVWGLGFRVLGVRMSSKVPVTRLVYACQYARGPTRLQVFRAWDVELRVVLGWRCSALNPKR